MAVPTALQPGDYTIEFDETTSAQLFLAGWVRSSAWPAVAQATLQAEGYQGLTLTNPRVVSDPSNPSGGLAAVDVHVPQPPTMQTQDVSYLAPQQLIVGELLMTVLLAAIRGAVAVTIALVVKYVVTRATTPAPPGSPVNGVWSVLKQNLPIVVIAALVFALASFARSVGGAHAR